MPSVHSSKAHAPHLVPKSHSMPAVIHHCKLTCSPAFRITLLASLQDALGQFMKDFACHLEPIPPHTMTDAWNLIFLDSRFITGP